MKQKEEVVLFLCTTEDDAGDAERRGKKLSLDSRGLPSAKERVAGVGVSECGPLAEVATPGGSRYSGGCRSPTTSTTSQRRRLPGRRAAAETMGKSRRSTDLKGRVVEEGEAKAGRARGDAMAVPVMRPGNWLL
ncbi:hypothetical protein BHM03_00059463 [Ensete ventricosum]|nr:hypothetical protein BHM03_00059463 [Ensete ventricosum]